MNRYECWNTLTNEGPGVRMASTASTLSECKAFAERMDRIGPGWIHRIEIRKFPWWRTWFGNNRPIRYRYVALVNDFAIVEK